MTVDSTWPTLPEKSPKEAPLPYPSATSHGVIIHTRDFPSPEPMNLFGKVTDFVDHHLQSVRIGVALIGVTGFVLIGRSIRVMKTFHAVSDIPEEFIRKQVTLRGKVRGYEGHCVMVEHLPIIRGLYGMKKKQESLLPVCLAGVSLSEGNLTSLVNMTPVDSMVWFRMLAVTEAKQLECIVTRRKNLVSTIMVNEYIVKQGFGQVRPAHSSIALHPTSIRLIQRLTKAESYAEKKAKGIWAKPSLKERMNERRKDMKDRMNERTRAMKNGAKEMAATVTRPITTGMAAITSARNRAAAFFRWNRKSPKDR